MMNERVARPREMVELPEAPIPIIGVSRPRADPRPGMGHRPHVEGRFIYVGTDKLWVRGVTYGTFLPSVPGDEGYDAAVADEDFARMAASGINAVRLYTVPPSWLLDVAQKHGLWVSIDIPWEEHIAFLEQPGVPGSILARVAEGVGRIAGHPAILAVSIGNEIPSRIVRWHGAAHVQDFLEQLADAAHAADPSALVTYVNYPSTEYLRVRGIDYDSWNVYLEGPADFERYVARLQNLSVSRPVVVTELGADSRRMGDDAQAALIASQIRAAFAAGSSGTFVFAWTDEWARGDSPVVDWDFGITSRDRRPKPALGAVEAAYRAVPFPDDLDWPSISVVICSYNGARVIGRCLEALTCQDYPDFEVIVIDDGSTDSTAEIAASFDVRLIRTPNRGLSAARNEGLAQARGEVIAYIDDDAWPDQNWLRYLGWMRRSTGHAGFGGPNLPPPGDGNTADLVALAPGGANHVLRSDTEAEHVPGCNSAFVTDRLRDIGGYDTRFRTAGDDVDVCWRLHERGWTIGFSAGAQVWHHRRPTARGYLRQQRGYGFAEALLEKKWPGRFNRLGHVAWPGQLYGSGARQGPLVASSVYAGTWGSAAYQSIYERTSHLAAAPLMPEWWLVIAALLGIGLLGLTWSPLLLAWPLALTLSASSVLVAAVIASDAVQRHVGADEARFSSVARLTGLILGQSLARLRGRLAGGLTPWRRRGHVEWAVPRTRRCEQWTEEWHSPEARLRTVETDLQRAGVAVARGGPTDRWDLEARTGAFGSARVLGTIEEHGHGRQLVRWRVWPRIWVGSLAAIATLAVASAWAVLDGKPVAAGIVGLSLVVLVVRVVLDAGQGVEALARACVRSEPSQ